MIAAKNLVPTGAATDLGLGNLLSQELQDQENERLKKLRGAEPTQSLFSGAAMQLLGTSGSKAGV